jgi:hypothetical protein
MGCEGIAQWSDGSVSSLCCCHCVGDALGAFVTSRHLFIPVTWVVGVFLAIYGSTFGNASLTHYGMPLTEQGRLEVALSFVAAVSIECFLLWAVLRPATYQRSWGRALLATLILASCLSYFGFIAMHAPTALLFHIYWLVAMLAAVVGLLFTSAAADIISRRKRPPPDRPPERAH